MSFRLSEYEESANGEEYFDGKKWHVKKSVIEKESRDYMLHERFHPASAYHQTAIARDIANVRKKRG